MKLTEVLVEPTVIGFSVLAAAALALSPAIDPWVLDDKTSNLVVVTLVAYFAGILFDKVADTILNRLLVVHRLVFASRLEPGEAIGGDRFPEDRYLIAIMQAPGPWGYASYHRSRIRLSRAMVVLAPALAVAVAIRLSNEADWLRTYALAVVVVVYAALYIDRHREAQHLPRTDHSAGKQADKIAQARLVINDELPLARLVVSNEPWGFGLAVALMAVAGIVMFAGNLSPSPAPPGYARAAWQALALTGLALMLMAAMFATWWRVQKTFFELLRNYYRFKPVASS